MKYAITGVTGKFGQVALKQLLTLVAPTDVVALARNVDKASKMVPTGVEVRPGDYTNPTQLVQSLAGVDHLLFISSLPGGEVSREQQHLNVVKAAKDAGVSYIAYTSFPHADIATAPLAADHQATETAIIASGLKYSFLRNNWYLENEGMTIQGALASQPFVIATGDSHVGWANEADYAKGAAIVLASEAPKKIYEFAGEPRTYQDLAVALQRVSGKEFPILSVSPDDLKQQLVAGGLNEGMIGFIMMTQQLIIDGALDEATTDLADVLERPLASIDDALKEMLA